MLHGLLWLPLLVLFTGLAWAGWNEYQKLESYKVWAADFETAKYDVRAVLGVRGSDLVWGKPSRQGPVFLETIDLGTLQRIQVQQQNQLLSDPEASVNGSADLLLELRDRQIAIPFTEASLALKWRQFLNQRLGLSA
ncbi:hypothetical protein [Synechococcus elongatus]|uniref:Uncharacterized protein n=2 Tax=Synechococcus elongatus TaxID=32046 RepID=Q31KL3_SYNE7|nr:hypothetical protein [Synechococcus elongatus]ABB58406.1 conserved hypothetical protein [Synechococcus elongatus PCC 7942 = FACHB-805]AJD57131.1 hypothetical protein M744_04380 [Synechococcus elongatus UTEX 2973]MBD2587128.1 hypothetical protein [Synechococcus elongatus FACHB-242]MBD2688199.1 hypothetical protein [Synechococcus elongatus FACHB-1061]MBD2706090.1 hypothetical protein [Synechococcus elongatus PCC 7942 = FACHB-805]